MKPLTIRIKRRKIMKYVAKPGFDETHYWFTINGGNGQILATSEMYTKKHNATKTVNRIACSLFSAEVIDET